MQRKNSIPLDGSKVCFLCRTVFNGRSDVCSCGSRDWNYLTSIINERKISFETEKDIPWARHDAEKHLPPLVRRQAI